MIPLNKTHTYNPEIFHKTYLIQLRPLKYNALKMHELLNLPDNEGPNMTGIAIIE